MSTTLTTSTTGRRGAVILSALATTFATALIAAPQAQAAPTSATIAASTATLDLDAADDAVNVTIEGGLVRHGLAGGGLASALDWDSAAAGDQTVPANGTFTIVLNGSDGADALTVTATNTEIAKAVLNGDGGDDLLTGARTADDLRGGAGNDRLVGFVGGDDMEGGDGNDTLVWNNGDGSDVMDGEAGNDGVEVNGAATAADVFTIVPAGARVDFDRTNLVPFSLDISTERLEVNGLGGNDSATAGGALAPLILISLSGGAGADALTGADGPDFIEGGEDNDVLAGGGGDDRIVGDRGGDAMSGGDGDDTLVWNNGDGSDVMNGESGRDTIEVNGAPTAGDAFTVAFAGARIDFDRTNLVPFSLDIGTTEAMALNGLGGDDTVAVGEVGAFHVTAAGGSGNDTLNGAGGAETLLGGSGDDAITPGRGRDVAAGDEGNDTIVVRDGVSDFVRCGDGADAVTADSAKVDVGMQGCETVTRKKPTVAISGSTAKVRRSIAAIRLTCPAASAVSCRGTLRLTTLAPVRTGSRRAVLQLGRARFDIRAGRPATVRLKLVPRAVRLVNRRTGILGARASAQTGSAGDVATSTRRIKLDFGRRAR